MNITIEQMSDVILNQRRGDVLNPQLENLYQVLAAEAMADYQDQNQVDRDFYLLFETLGKDPAGQREGAESSPAGRGTKRVDQQGSGRETSRKRKDCSFSCEDVVRQPVKSIRRMFESISNESHTSGPVRKLQRVERLKEQRRFWEQLSGPRDSSPGLKRDSDGGARLESKSAIVHDRRSFWETVSAAAETSTPLSKPRVVAAITKSCCSTVTDTTSPVIPLASPEPSLSDSGRNSHESIPECDQETPNVMSFSQESLESSSVNPTVGPNDTTAYDNISLREVYGSAYHLQAHSSDGETNTCSRSLSTDENAGFMYDEYEKYPLSEHPDTRSGSGDAVSSSALNCRLGRMFAVNPQMAKAVGSGLYHGLVGMENKFFVNVRDAGTGFLTVGVKGAGGTAQAITQRALDDWSYEVSYTVQNPGHYILFVRWGDYYIRDSPFICHISDPAAIL